MKKNRGAAGRPLAAALPLGALAAGFGFAPLAQAQGDAPPPPAASASAPESALPTVRIKAHAEPSGKDTIRATTTTIGKGQQALRDIPQSVTVVTEKLIDDRNLDTLKDTLKNTAGISFQAAEGGEEDIRLRGFSLQATGDIFIDGMRDPAFYERDSFNWDRLEVLRGSASMLFGRGSTGGAVNQASKQPMLIDQQEVSLTVGTGGVVRSTADFNVKTAENAALRINGMVAEGDRSGLKTDKAGIAPSFRWGIGTADEFAVNLYHLDNKNGINYGMPWLPVAAGNPARVLLPVGPSNYYGMASDYSAGGVSYSGLTHIHRFQDGGELKTALRAAHYNRDQRASAIRFAAAGLQPDGQAVTAQTLSDATVLTRGTQNKVTDMSTRHVQSDYNAKARWFGLEHALLTGADFAHEDFTAYTLGADSPTLTKPTTTIGTPNDGASVDESLRTLRVQRTFNAKAFGLYFQDLVQIAPAWKLLAGLRWDRFEGTYHQPELRNASDAVTQAEATRSRTDSLWSRRFGVLYQPTPTQSYHLSYGTSFNTSGDTYQYDVANFKVAPEGSRNVELGAKIDWLDGRLSTRAALFHATKYNERNRDDTSINEVNYVLSGQRHAAGLELDITGRITPAWEVFASYSYIPDAEIDKASSVNGVDLVGERVGARPGLTPRHSGTVWTTYKLSPAWRVGGGLNARSSDTPIAPPAGSNPVGPRYVTADLMAECTVRDLSFKLNVTNITNKIYADMLYRGHYIPGRPRTVQLTTAFRF